jgi:hypothetical protein
MTLITVYLAHVPILSHNWSIRVQLYQVDILPIFFTDEPHVEIIQIPVDQNYQLAKPWQPNPTYCVGPTHHSFVQLLETIDSQPCQHTILSCNCWRPLTPNHANNTSLFHPTAIDSQPCQHTILSSNCLTPRTPNHANTPFFHLIARNHWLPTVATHHSFIQLLETT